jgi:calcium permeable stress-gated cation channel
LNRWNKSRLTRHRHRTPSSSTNGVKWLHDFRSLDDKFVLRHQSLDGYLFLRFFKLIILISFIGCLLSWPILLPVNSTGGGKSSQLDKLAFGNVEDNKRFYAHAIVAWLFLGRSYHSYGV